MQNLMYQVLLVLGYIIFSFHGFDLSQFSHLGKLDLLTNYIFGTPTQLIYHQVSQSEDPKKKREFFVHATWMNWEVATNPGANKTSNATYYSNDLKDIDLVTYSYLSLDQKPQDRNLTWNGQCLYDTMTDHCVKSILEKGGYEKNHDFWQAIKVEAMLNYTSDHTKKFIWQIGGPIDLRLGLNMSQIANFTRDVVELLSKAGDGIVMDFEHLSDRNETKQEQLKTMAHTLLQTREALDKAGLKNKTLGFDTRYNSFWSKENGNVPDKYKPYLTDGECLIIDQILKQQNSSLAEVLDYVQLQIYAINPFYVNEGPDGLNLKNYETILKETEKVLPKNKIVIGFEPGARWGSDIWEGLDEDKKVIDYAKFHGYRGVMFQAINDQHGKIGEDAVKLAKYAKEN